MSLMGKSNQQERRIDESRPDFPEIDLMDNEFQKNPIEIYYWNLKEIYLSFKENPYYKRLAHKFRLTHNSALKRDVIELIIAWVYWVVKDNRNFIVYIFGEQGDGKSLFAIWFANLIKTAWEDVQHVTSEFRWGFSEDELRHMFRDPTFDNHHTAILDENPKMHGRGTTISEDALITLIEELRVTGKSIIICSPTFKKHYPGMTVIFETAGKKPEETKTRVLIHFIPPGYPPTLKNSFVGSIVVDVGVLMALYDKFYLPKKIRNVGSVQDSGGSVAPVMDTARIDAVVNEFVTYAKDQGWEGSRKGLLELYYPRFARYKKEKNQPLNFSKDEELALIRGVYDVNKKETDARKKAEAEQRAKNLDVKDVHELADHVIAKELLAEQVFDQKTFDAWDLSQNGQSYEKIGAKFNVSKVTIKNWVDKVKPRVPKRRGTKWEILVEKELNESNLYSEVNRNGDPGKYDVYGIRKKDGVVEVYNAKALQFLESSTSVLIADVKPELDYAWEKSRGGTKVEVYLYLINVATYKKEKRFVDFRNPEATYIFNF